MGKDVSAKIFVSQHYPYPLLPNEPDIRLLASNEDRLTLNWEPSPSEAIAPIQYCVAISAGRSMADNCLLDSYLKDSSEEDYELDLLPSAASTSFTYWWGRTVKNMLRQTRLRAIKELNVRIECLDKQNLHSIEGLDHKRNTKYFIEVYARNSITNATSMYRSLNVTLANREPIAVKDNQQIVIHLNKTNNFTQLLNYTELSPEFGHKLWLFVKSCSGVGPITLTARTPMISKEYNSHSNSTQTLFATKIFNTKTMEISIDKSIKNKNLLFEIMSMTASDRSIVISISEKRNRFEFPMLPEDTKLRVMDTLTDCQSVTLAWNASPDDRVMYCIYEKPVFDHNSYIEPIDNVCLDNRLSTTSDDNHHSMPVRKILCKRYQKSSKRRFNNKIIQTIRRLSPGQRYVFQVMLTKNRGRTLTYEQVWVSTKSRYHCQ